MSNKSKKNSKKSSDQSEKKSKSFASGYTRLDSIPILYPNNPSSYRLWTEACKVYFPREFGQFGNFVSTKKKFKPPPPRAPKLKVAARKADSQSLSSDSDQEGDEMPGYDSDDSGMSEVTARMVHTELVKDYAKSVRREQHLAPQMYATLQSNLSEESIQVLSQERNYQLFADNYDYVGLIKLIDHTHGSAKSGWAVKDKIIVDRLLLGTIQKTDESILAFKNRFNSVAKSCDGYDDQQLAVIFIENMSAKHEEFKRDKANSIADERISEFPATVEQAYRSASRYTRSEVKPKATADAATLIAKPKPKGSEKQKQKASTTTKTSESKTGSAKANKYPCTTCSLLGLPDDHGHFPNQCPNKDRAKKLIETSSESTMMAVGFEPIDGVTLTISGNTEVISEKVLAMASKLASDEVVLDNGSTVNLFGNRELVSHSKQSKPINISGVGGDILCSERGSFAGVLSTYVHEAFMANVLSQARVEDLVKNTQGGSLSYDEDSCAFELNLPKIGNWVFERRNDLGGLRVAKSQPQAAFITVTDNRKRYTKRELKGADDAREVLRRANFPADKSLAHLVNSGNLLNSPITSSDVHRATKIDGGDRPSAMGKGTKKKTKVFCEEPSNATVNKNVQLEGDIFFVDSEAFLLTVSNFGYAMCAYLGNETIKGTRSAANIWKFLSLMFAAYVSYGFKIKTFFCDHESGILSNRVHILSTGAKFEPRAPDAKAKRCERRIRTVKERDRCTRQSVPFKMFGIILIYSVLNNVRCINMFPCTASPHVAPREQYSGIRTDYKRDFCVASCDYCLTYDTSNTVSNSSRRRMEECIALMPVGNRDGDVVFYSLRTGKTFTRNRFKVYPTPDSIINHLNLAYANATKRDYSLPPVYRTAHHAIEDDEPVDDALEMEPPLEEVQPMHGREPVAHDNFHPVVAQEAPEEPSTDAEPSPVEECDVDAQPDGDVDEQPEENVGEDDDQLEAHEDSIDAAEPTESDELSAPDVIPLTDTPLRYPKRENRTTWKNKVFHISAKQALRQYGRKGLVSMAKEIRSVAIDKQAMIPVNPNKLSKAELKTIITSSLFLKEKFNPDGTFEKLKARLVAGGHLQNRELYDQNEISSPTVGTSSVMTTIAIAAQEHRCVATADIGVAYLNANLPREKAILMRLSKENAAILVLLKPEYEPFLLPNGTMIVKLTKALYGCIESAKLWYNHISKTLESMEFVRNPIDICVFNKVVSGVQCTICLHVDDLLITSTDESIIESVLTELERVYKQVTIKRGKIQQYLGMLLDFSVKGKCYVSMPKFTDELISKSGVTGVAATPALDTLFTIREDAVKLDEEQSVYFHSTVAMCQYLSKRVRPDTLLPIVFLSTRVSAPDVDDLHKLQRVVKYINGTKELGICIEPAKDGIMNIRAYVDASFAVHKEFRSHTGIVITFGGGGIYFRSTKQRLNTTSSTEAELVAVSDALPYVVHIREFLTHQGYDLGPASLFQDNMSTIKLIENGRSNSDRTRHINIRFFFVSDRVKSGELKVEHMPTDEMIADILTKPLQGEKFRVLRKQLLNWDK